MICRLPTSTLFPYTTLFRSGRLFQFSQNPMSLKFWKKPKGERLVKNNFVGLFKIELPKVKYDYSLKSKWNKDRKSTRLNSSHVAISYAVFCLKKQIQYIAMT